MTLKSMIYIRDLLEENERKTRAGFEMAKKALHDAEYDGADNTASLRTMYEKTYKTWSAAHSVLQEFENLEW